MACPVCGANHTFNNCLKYTTASQPLKDLLLDVYDNVEVIKANVAPDGYPFDSYEDAIYFGFYQPMANPPS